MGERKRKGPISVDFGLPMGRGMGLMGETAGELGGNT